MADGPEYETFEEFYRDPEVRAHLRSIQRCLSCTDWEALVILLLTQRAQVDISIQRPPDDEGEEPWRKP